MQIDKPSIASSIQKAQCKARSKIGIIYTNSCVLKTYKYKQQSKESEYGFIAKETIIVQNGPILIVQLLRVASKVIININYMLD